MEIHVYDDDEQRRSELDKGFDALEKAFDVLGQALGPLFAATEARENAKMEFCQYHGHWPTDEELDRSGWPIHPLPSWYGPLI